VNDASSDRMVMNKPLSEMTEREREIHCMETTELCRLEQLGDELAKEELELRYQETLQ